jgi:hypothetical protein
MPVTLASGQDFGIKAPSNKDIPSFKALENNLCNIAAMD